MRALLLILILMVNFALIQWAYDGETLAKLEATVLFVAVSSLLVVGAHFIAPALRHDNAGHRLEFFGFLAALIGVVAAGAITQGQGAAEEYENAKKRVENEQLLIRDLVSEVYDPHCGDWQVTARPVRRDVEKVYPDFTSKEFQEEFLSRLTDVDRSCFLLWGARSVRYEGEYQETLSILKEVSEIGAIPVSNEVMFDFENWAYDPFELQVKAEKLRFRAEWIGTVATYFNPLEKFLVLLALSIGVGRTAFLSFFNRTT